MLSQFDDNPLVEEREGELQGLSSEVTNAQKKRPREDNLQEPDSKHEVATHEPPEKEPRLEEDAEGCTEGEPFIGYSVEAVDDVDEADETYGELLNRVAALESGRRNSACAQRFQMTLKTAEREALRGCMSHLRALLAGLQGKRTKPTTAAAAAAPSSSSTTTATNPPYCPLQPSQCAQMMELYGNAERLARLGTRSHWLKCAGARTRAMNPEGCSWTPPLATETSGGTVPTKQFVDKGRRRFEEMEKALQKVPPELIGPAAPALSALSNKLQQVCETSDALCSRQHEIERCVPELMARWNQYSLWGAERSLLIAEEQMIDHLAAQNPTAAEEQLLSQQQRQQKRLHQAEIAVATLLASASDVKVPKVSQGFLRSAMQRYEDLQKLRSALYRELVSLRKLLKEKLLLSTRSVVGGECFFLGARAAEEGRRCLLQHSCAALCQRSAELNKHLVTEVLRGSMACPPSPEQEERLLQYEVKSATQHASIVTLIAENARLQQRIKGVSLVQLLATSGNGKFASIAGKLRSTTTSAVGKHTTHQEGNARVNEEAVREEEEEVESAANNIEVEEPDILGRFVDVFARSTEELVKSINTRLWDLSNLYKDERQLQRDVAFLVRLTVAGERLLHGKVGVPLMSGYAEDITILLEEARLRLVDTKRSVRQLPSLRTLCESLQSQSASHAEQLLKEHTAAEAVRAQLLEDLEWCKQQSPEMAGGQLVVARKELQKLRVSLETITKQGHDPTPLELETQKAGEQLAQLRQQLEKLQEEVDLAEYQLQCLEDDEVVDAQEDVCEENGGIAEEEEVEEGQEAEKVEEGEEEEVEEGQGLAEEYEVGEQREENHGEMEEGGNGDGGDGRDGDEVAP